MKFVVWSYDFDALCGGNVALHKLCQLLVKLGHDARISRTLNAEDRERAVVIYPEIITGNPLGAKNVVRWLLNTPGVKGGDGIYGDTDLVFKYSNAFRAPDESRCNGLLHVVAVDFELFRDRNEPRSGVCFAVRKGVDSGQHPRAAVCIDDYRNSGGNRYLAECFNRFGVFVSYDRFTFLSVQAALCGCVSVVVPASDMTASEFREKMPMKTFGVAYGWGEICRAVETQHLVRDHVEKSTGMESVSRFVEIVEARFT